MSNIPPYVENIVNQLQEEKTFFSPPYSYEWLKQSLDKDSLEKKVGKHYKTIPIEIRNYYQAEGYLTAIIAMVHMDTGEKKKISCDLNEVLSQEISKELEIIVRRVLHKFHLCD